MLHTPFYYYRHTNVDLLGGVNRRTGICILGQHSNIIFGQDIFISLVRRIQPFRWSLADYINRLKLTNLLPHLNIVSLSPAYFSAPKSYACLHKTRSIIQLKLKSILLWSLPIPLLCNTQIPFILLSPQNFHFPLTRTSWTKMVHYSIQHSLYSVMAKGSSGRGEQDRILD